MGKPNTNGKTPAVNREVHAAPDSETRALNGSPEFQDLMAEGDKAIQEGRTRAASDVFRRQRERRRAAARH